jgi:hypothetical protein
MQPVRANGNAVNTPNVQQGSQVNNGQQENQGIDGQQQAPVVHPQAQNAALLAAFPNHTPLMLAAQNADPHIVTMLLNIGTGVQAAQSRQP